MPDALLITQCLQNDFVNPIGKRDPLPNTLHVGYEEARRLMGEIPAEGPVAHTMRWAYAQPAETLGIIHIRDWHDAADPAQREHLDHYGAHCLAASPGAAFCFEVPAADRATVIDARGLNDFLGTPLAEALGRPRRVGLIGVWTEAKISFLAYELRTRHPDFEIGVCSALTASSSRAQHFLALDQMAKLLHVAVFASVGEFTEWLCGEAVSIPLPSVGAFPELAGAEGVDPTDARLLRYLFRDCRRVDVEPLAGGFSGNVVLRAASVDALGQAQVPHVVKIGPRAAIGQERAAFERIEAVLGNSAPRVADFADLGERGAIKYRYAAMGAGRSTTFQRRYQEGMPADEVRQVLEDVFVDQLGRLYAAATLEKCRLLRDYAFDAALAPRVRARVESLQPPAAIDAERVWRLYADVLPRIGAAAEDHYQSYVHGDLNGANIILDAHANVWLIDFFHTRRGHVLMDLAKLENDLLYIFTPLADDAALAEAMRLSDALLAVEDLADPLPQDPPSRLPHLARAWETARVLRSFHAALVKEDRDPLQWLIAQMRYAVHTLAFDESSRLQKLWALHTAARAAAAIERRTTGVTMVCR